MRAKVKGFIAGVVRPVVVLTLTGVVSIASVEVPSAGQVTPDFLTSNIDSTASPRQDFFQYATGGGLKRNPSQEDQTAWGTGSSASEEVYRQIREISEAAAVGPTTRGRAAQLIGAVWATGMDTATINAQGLTPLQPDLDRIDRIRSTADLIDVVAVLHRRRMLVDDWFTRPAVLFAGEVQTDDAQSHRGIYSLTAEACRSAARCIQQPTHNE